MGRKLSTLQKLFNFLEDPYYPSVGPHLRFLGFTGLWHPIKTPFTKLKKIIFYVIIIFFFSQYIKSLISFNSDSLKLILQYAPFHMGIIKSCFFQKDYKLWEKLIAYISAVERSQLGKNEKSLDQTINSYIQRNRVVTYFFWAMAFFSNITIFSEPYLKNVIVENGTSVYNYMFDGYTPFKKEPPGYYMSMFIQTVLGNILSAYIVGWDNLVVSIMIFFAGQLKVARLYCAHVIKHNGNHHENIADIHRFYITLVRYQKVFNSLISPIMFFYLIVISVNLGVCIIQIAKLKDDLPTLASSCVFVTACLIQLLFFYWHSHEVTVESTLVSYGIFESNWIMVDNKLQREIALLGITTTKKLVFKAGPFNEMSLSTFLGILRTSYSFFTLLSETNS